MKKYTYRIEKSFWDDRSNRLIFIKELLDFITLFNSPKIDDTALSVKIDEVFKSSNGVYSLIISKDEKADHLKLFQSGELIYSHLVKNQLEVEVELSEKLSDTVKNEINCKFLNLQKTYPVKEKTTHKATITKNSETQKFEISFLLENIFPNEFSKKFMAPFNKICRLLTDSQSPEFTQDDLVYEIKTSSYEEFYRLNKTSDGYDVSYEEYIFDTGHYAHPKNGHISFSLSKKNYYVLTGSIQASWIRMDVETDESTAEKIKTILIEKLI